jgi:hypothetical protein
MLWRLFKSGYSTPPLPPRFLSTPQHGTCAAKSPRPAWSFKACFEALQASYRVLLDIFHLAFATDDDILDTSIQGITFNCMYYLFAARDGTSISGTVCKLWDRRNNEVCWLH